MGAENMTAAPKFTPGPCPFIYPSFMAARDRCIEIADNAFVEMVGRWASSERAGYIAAIDAGEMPASAGYAAARAALTQSDREQGEPQGGDACTRAFERGRKYEREHSARLVRAAAAFLHLADRDTDEANELRAAIAAARAALAKVTP